MNYDYRKHIYTKWLTIRQTSFTGKTYVFAVSNSENHSDLGEIKWHRGFRKYSFYPKPETLFESTCLRDIAGVLDKLMLDYKEGKM
jgi:hypothetical protein